jgi:hypothetical protein
MPALRCRRQYQEQQGGARGFALFEFGHVRFYECRHVAPGHRRLMLFLCVLFRQDMIDHANRVRGDMAVCPRPLHDRVHPLADAAPSHPLKIR